MKLDTKLREEDTDATIKHEECYILIFEYIGKSLDKLYYNFDKHRDI